MAEPYPLTQHSLADDKKYRSVPIGYPEDWGPPGVLALMPDLSPRAIAQEARQLANRWSLRDGAFRRWDEILEMKDANKGGGLESMVANDARTLFSLAVFLASAQEPRRTVAVGSQGKLAERRAGSSERALAAWWQQVDESRILNGQEPFRRDLAYWLCLYGWYAVEFAAVEKDGLMVPVAIPLNPAECFPFFADGLNRFVRRYSTTVADVARLAHRLGVAMPPGRHAANKSITVIDWFWRSPNDEIVRAVVVQNMASGDIFLKEPYVVEGVNRIPVLVGRVASTPDGEAETGSVFWENERPYADFNKWLSFMMTLAKEHAKTPVVTHNLNLEEKDLTPTDLRSGSAVIETDDPEAKVERVPISGGFPEVGSLLGIIDGMLQRGGFPYIMYGGLGRELSGFAISQLLQAAERRIGPQLHRLALIDSLVGQHWLERFRSGRFESATLAGRDVTSPEKVFIEKFGPSNVPNPFRVMSEVPLRVGNDLMAKMAIARQALGPTDQVLDHVTVLDEILQMQDPILIIDRIGRDAAERLAMPLRAALQLKSEAVDTRNKGGPGADEAARLLDLMADKIMEQAGQAAGAQPSQRVAPEVAPPEQFGISPDVVRAARQEQVPNVRR